MPAAAKPPAFAPTGKWRFHRVVLVGFMGAGKTTVGRLVAPLLEWQFRDADQVLCEQQSCTIADMFARLGEAAFRKLEADAVRALLQQTEIVIALGGGALESTEVAALLSVDPSTLRVFLQTSLPVSLMRCQAEAGGAVRPVLAARDALHERYLRRQPLYQAAQLHLDSSTSSPDSLAASIVAYMRGE